MAKAMGFGLGVPFYYPFFAPASMGYDESIMKYQYNPAKVKELLTKAGYPNGIDVELRVIDREPENTIAQFAQQMFEANGIRAKLARAERTVHIGIITDGKFQFSFARDALRDAGGSAMSSSAASNAARPGRMASSATPSSTSS